MQAVSKENIYKKTGKNSYLQTDVKKVILNRDKINIRRKKQKR